MPAYTLDRLIVSTPDVITPIGCVAPEVPYKVQVTNTTSRVQTTTWVCADPTVAPCDPTGILTVIEAAGFELDDGPCS